jgi:threonine/homoserine/homoserine lactone efflux protein
MPIETADLLVFLTAALTLNLTPGNDMMFVLGQSIRSGFRAGFAASLGIATGSLIHLSLVALGVAVILNQHPVVFDAIRYAGAAYLVWIAWKALTTASAARIEETRELSTLAAWRDGALVNLLNPKIIIFMFALLPPFIRPENGAPLLQLLILGLIFNVGGTLVNIVVAAFSGKIGELLSRSAAASRWFGRISAGLFVVLAARLAFEKQ